MAYSCLKSFLPPLTVIKYKLEIKMSFHLTPVEEKEGKYYLQECWENGRFPHDW